MREALAIVLRQIWEPVIAVSGGVDSVTLAALAGTVLPSMRVIHATSPAVPVEATERVRHLAAQLGWHLTVVRAGEFDDPNYRANPVNRCFYCKTHLYGEVRRHTARQILSGANMDDLGEYRPGLEAAREYGVRHPYIEAGVDKLGVRRIARELGLEDVSELPSSPCLSSRVETGIPIDPNTLDFIHHVEQLVAARLHPQTIRCRIRAQAVVIELDSDALDTLRTDGSSNLAHLITAQCHFPIGLPVQFEPYRNGSAFLVKSR